MSDQLEGSQSSLTWLDYSTADRRRALDAIEAFNEPDTRDELGVGTVRDALADQLFPGTSTIQTRARYFLFVPWVYQRHEHWETSSREIADKARKDEIALIEALAASGDKEGIIGIQARSGLKRLASNVYWQGLGALGIRLNSGESQDQYHRRLDRYYVRRESALKPELGEPSQPVPLNWHPSIPPAPENFPKGVILSLTPPEAEYLRDRILTACPGTAFSFLVDRGRPCQSTDFPWMHPQAGEFSEKISRLLDHARNFSEIIHGAALLYNLMLSELKKDSDLVGKYREELAEWGARIDSRTPHYATWDLLRFWEQVTLKGSRVPPGAREFVTKWIERARSLKSPAKIAGDADLRALVHHRESTIKRGLARLDNPRARDLWQGASMASQFDFRWRVAQAHVRDILAALDEGSRA